MELLDETTIKNTETGGTYSYPNWLFGCSARVTVFEYEPKIAPLALMHGADS